jgi:predicted ester cyclase
MTNKEIVKAWYAAIDSIDISTLKNLMDSKYQQRNPFAPAPIGGDEQIGMLQMISSSFEGGEHRIEMMIGEGDHVAVSARWIAKHTGEFNGIPASGNLVDLPFLVMFNIVNGKVVSSYVQFNPMTMMAQVGAAPPGA